MKVRRRSVLTVLALVLSLSVHVAVATPLQAASELAALVCCSDCDHPEAAGTAARCCGVEREALTITATSPVKSPPVAWAAVSTWLPDPLPAPAAFADVRSPVTRSEPIFLVTRVLRI